MAADSKTGEPAGAQRGHQRLLVGLGADLQRKADLIAGALGHCFDGTRDRLGRSGSDELATLPADDLAGPGEEDGKGLVGLGDGADGAAGQWRARGEVTAIAGGIPAIK